MGVVRVLNLDACAGKKQSSSGQHVPSDKLQVPDNEAAAADYIPAEGFSACLISPHRILVTGGSLEDDRVLPFTVLRHLDLDASHSQSHAWQHPVCLRDPSSSRRRRRGNAVEKAFPVCRVDQSVTLVPDNAFLYLIGGMKVGGADDGNPCKSTFFLDPAKNEWHLLELEHRGATKRDSQSILGPRFAHSSIYFPTVSEASSRSRARSAGFIVVYGGYTSQHDHVPTCDVHILDVRNKRWDRRPAGRPSSSSASVSATPEDNAADVAAPAPGLAYHAASASPDGSFLVVHGGNVADLQDHLNMSADLHLYDVRAATWTRPTMHASSCAPPTARRRHSIVQGVGKHEGSLVMFGGTLEDGEHTSELFLFRLLRNEDGVTLTVIWERMDLISSVHRPLADDPNNVSQRPLSDRNLAVSGGCLVAVPAIGKYVLVGGKAHYGIRESPLMLDAMESADFGDAEVPSETEEHARSQPAGKGVRAVERAGRNTGTSAGASKDAQFKIVDAANPDADEQETGKPEAPQPEPGTAALTRGKREQAPKRATKSRARKARSKPAASPPTPEPLPGDNVINASSAKLDTTDARREDEPVIPNDYEPMADAPVEPAVATRVKRTAQRSGTKRPLHDADSDFVDTPRLKRNKSARLARQAVEARVDETPDTPPPSNDGEGDEPVHDESFGSDFVTASEHAAKGQQTATRARGGRGGRGVRTTRGRGRGRGKAALAASARAAAETVETTKDDASIDTVDATVVQGLRDECERRKREKLKSDEENRKLNSELEKAVDELRLLRAEQSGAPRGHTGLAERTDEEVQSSQRGGGLLPPNSDISGEQDGANRGDEVSGLRAKNVQLRELVDEATLEKENVAKSLKELEEEHRDVTGELNETRNQLKEMTIQCNSLRKEVAEERKVVEEAKISEEESGMKARRSEEEKLLLKRDIESLRQDMSAERDQKQLHGREADKQTRALKAVQDELATAKDKYEQFETVRKQLERDVTSEREKCTELQLLLDTRSRELRAVEDRNVELVADADHSKADLARRSADYDATLKEADQLRDSLSAERKGVTSTTITQTRLQRDLDRAKRENERLRRRADGDADTLRKLMPSLTLAAKHIGTILDRSVDDVVALDADDTVANGNANRPAAAVAAGDGEAGNDDVDEP